MFYPRLDPPATLESKKFHVPDADSRNSVSVKQATLLKALQDGSAGSPGSRPHPQCPLWVPIRAGTAAPEIRPPADERDSGRFAPSATLRPRATASTGRRLKTSPDPRGILPAQRGKCRHPFTPLPAAKGNPTRPRRPSMPIRQRLPRPAPATAVDMPAGARQILDRVS